MVQVGEISVKAKVDTTSLDSGTKKVQSRFKEMDASGKMSENSMKGLSSAAGSFGTKLATAGTVGIAALGGLASKAPAVAGAMAKMKVTTGELTRTLGETFSGTFDSIAEGYANLVNNIESNPINFKTGLGAAGALAIGGGSISAGLGSGILGTGAIGALGGGAVGASIAGAGGALVAGGAGYFAGKAGGYAAESLFGAERGGAGAIAGAGTTGAVAGAGVGAIIGSIVPGIGTAIGAGVGAGIGALTGAGGEYLTQGSSKVSQETTSTDPYSYNRRTEELVWEYNN